MHGTRIQENKKCHENKRNGKSKIERQHRESMQLRKKKEGRRRSRSYYRSRIRVALDSPDFQQQLSLIQSQTIEIIKPAETSHVYLQNEIFQESTDTQCRSFHIYAYKVVSPYIIQPYFSHSTGPKNN